MIESQQPVKEHQRAVWKLQVIFGAVADILQLMDDVVGEVSNRAAGKRRQAGHNRGVMLAQQLLGDFNWISLAALRFLPANDCGFAPTGMELQIGVRSEKRVSSNLLASFHGLEQEGIPLSACNRKEGRNRCHQVRHDGLDHGHECGLPGKHRKFFVIRMKQQNLAYYTFALKGIIALPLNIRTLTCGTEGRMNREDFVDEAPGRLVATIEGAFGFVPSPLPPVLQLSWDFVRSLELAERSLSRLAGAGSTLPNPYLLITPFTRREAVLSSRIEGTQASLSDLLSYEAAGLVDPDRADVREVANYVLALEYGLRRIKEFPLSLRLVRELHERLMQDVRGQSQNKGEFRRHQNWIGSPGSTIDRARYIPPPPNELPPVLDALEKYLHASSRLPALVRTALIHYQFEAAHPFLDGNGRLGRLLITLMLISEGLLPQPLLYLSAYFERNRDQYYQTLLEVSQKNRWERWLEFFLAGVESQSKDALTRAMRLQALASQYRDRLQQNRSSGILLRLADHLFHSPAVTVKAVATVLNITQVAAQRNIDKLQRVGILKEITERRRGRIYLAVEIVRTTEEPNPSD